jgi:hypothetical protein
MKAQAIIKQQKEASILGKLTRWDYKEEDGKSVKHKVRMTIRGDQQVEEEGFDSSVVYAPVLRAYEALLLLSIAAVERCLVWMTDTSQDFLYRSIGNDVV